MTYTELSVAIERLPTAAKEKDVLIFLEGHQIFVGLRNLIPVPEMDVEERPGVRKIYGALLLAT